MIDIDNEIQQHYAEQELDESIMEQLLAMEAADAAAPQSTAATHHHPWRAVGVVAAVLLGTLTLGAVGTTALTANLQMAPEQAVIAPSEEPAIVDASVVDAGEGTANGLFDADANRLPKSQSQAIAGEDLVVGGADRRKTAGWGDASGVGGLLGQAPGPQQLGGGAPSTGADGERLGWAEPQPLGDINNVVYDLDKMVEPTGVANASNAHPLLNGSISLNEVGARSPGLEPMDATDAPADGDGYIARDGIKANDALQRVLTNDGRHGRYRHRGTPPLTPTNIDDRSTFSVDTDTAAWTRARTALTNGYFPNAGEVRPEEFINAFTYDYEAPRSGPFGVSTEIAPSPYGSGRHLVRIGVQGKRISVFERKPVHLTFLVDVSGSMQSHDKLELAKSGLRKLVGELKDGDTVAIVTYAGRTAIELEPTPVQRRGEILNALNRLTSSGGTAMGAGIDLAYQQAERSLEPGAINRVVLVSDGDANVGETNHDRLASKLRRAADKGITLTTLGFGSGGYNDRMMETLADKGDGQYHYIANERDAERVLVDGLTGTLQTIARDVKLQVSFDPTQVEGWRLIGYENRVMAHQDFRNDRVDAGEVGAGHQVTALYEVDLVDPDASIALGTLNLRYEAPGAEGAPAVERAMRLTGTPHESLGRASSDMRMAVVAGVFADALRGRPSITTDQMLGLLPTRPEYAEDDDELRQAIRQAKNLGL